MQLPLQTTLSLLQTRWKSILDPIIGNPTTNMAVIENFVLVTGDNQIPHLLGRVQQGWVVTDIQGVANIYRNAPFNSNYLILNSSAGVTCSIGVF